MEQSYWNCNWVMLTGSASKLVLAKAGEKTPSTPKFPMTRKYLIVPTTLSLAVALVLPPINDARSACLFCKGGALSIDKPFDKGGALSIDKPFDKGGALSIDKPFDKGGALSIDKPFDKGGALSIDKPFDKGGSLSIDK